MRCVYVQHKAGGAGTPSSFSVSSLFFFVPTLGNAHQEKLAARAHAGSSLAPSACTALDLRVSHDIQI